MVEENDPTGGSTAAYHHEITNGIKHYEDKPVIDVNTEEDDDDVVEQDEDASFKQRVELLLLCAVCHETVTAPLQLQCGHFFCTECVNLLNVDDIVRCALCGKTTPITETSVRKDDLAHKLLDLLEEFAAKSTPKVTKELHVNGDDVQIPVMTNGTAELDDSAESDESEGEEEEQNVTEENVSTEKENGLIDDKQAAHYDIKQSTPASEEIVHPPTVNIAVVTDSPAADLHSPEDNTAAQNTDEFKTLVKADVHQTNSDSSEQEVTPFPPPPQAPETTEEQERPADITIEPPPPEQMILEPECVAKIEHDDPVRIETGEPQEVKQIEVVPEPDQSLKETVEPEGADDSLLQPPLDYQTVSDHEEEQQQQDSKPVEIPAVREPVEHGVSDEEKPVSPTPDVEDQPHDDLKKDKSEEPELKPDQDETDYKMKPSEIKPSDVALAVDAQRQCETCHEKMCTCNTNSLLTPPVSMGSQQSVDTNTSQNASEEDYGTEILVEQLARFPVKESASHIEVAASSKIHITRWTYDDDGAIETFDANGKKKKCIHSGHHNFSGVTLSKLGFVFALNTSKNRIEEYSSVDGRKVKQFKLESCYDPQAVDIMPTGEVLVADQEKHRVIVYSNSKRSGNKPRAITHELLREPYDIATTNNAFYVTSPSTHSLLKMDLEGNLLWSYGHSDEKRKLKIPQGVCVDEVGMVYVVDRGSNCVLVFNKDGEFKGRVVDKNKGHMNRPWYVSVRDGLMAVLFSHNIVKTYKFA